MACGGTAGAKCWRYDIPTDKWILHSTLVNTHHANTPFRPFNDKLYCLDYSNGEVFTNATQAWSIGLTSPVNIGDGECSINYKDSFYIFGGGAKVGYVQKYNITTEQWSFPFTLNNGIYFSSCLLLPNTDGKVLILAVRFVGDTSQTATIVDLETYQQTPISTPTYFRAWGNNLVALGTRIFSVNGWNWSSNVPVVEEYHSESNSWSAITTPLIYPRHKGNALTVPASWFSKIPGGCNGVI